MPHFNASVFHYALQNISIFLDGKDDPQSSVVRDCGVLSHSILYEIGYR